MELSIDEEDINKVSINQNVTITLNYDETKSYTGKITNINQIGNYSSRGTSYTAIVEFKNDGNIKLGMSGSVSIEIEKAENVIAIPIEAVQTRGNEKYVLVVGDDNETSERIITTGISNSAYVEVKSGLNENETLRMISVDNTTSNKPFNKGEGNFNFNDMERPDVNYKTNDSTGGRNSR